jgi:uncharacterized protein
MDIATLSRHVQDAITESREVALVYLFGSRAELLAGAGHLGPMSDYDFGLWIDRGSNGPVVLSAFAHRMAKHLQTDRVDVVLLNDAPIELAYAIIAHGVLLFRRDAATQVESEATMMSCYGDYLPVLQAQRRDILEGGDYEKRVRRYREALRRTRRTLSEITSETDCL